MSKSIDKLKFQDLMQYRVHEILLVASPYDAFILEQDGRLSEQILTEFKGLNLSYAPRVWHAKNATIGLQMLSDRSYDLVIVMMRIADMDPITFGEKVKKSFPDKPIILLAFDESEITHLPQKRLEKMRRVKERKLEKQKEEEEKELQELQRQINALDKSKGK